MKFSFHPEAEAELNLSIDYYEDRAEGLGMDFEQIFVLAVMNLHKNPEYWKDRLK